MTPGPARPALVVMLMVLGACATGAPAPETTTPVTQAQEPEAAAAADLELATRSAPETADPPPPDPPAAAAGPTAAEMRLAALRARLPEFQELVGQDESHLRDLLGKPQFARNDHAARLWQYRSATCFLDVFLYPDGGDGAYQVAHYAVRPRGAVPVPADDCFLSLLERQVEG